MAEGITESSRFNAEEPKVWRCGNPQASAYKYPMPEPSGDPWERLLVPLLKKDKVQCDAWKDEVQNLLIFAGLFSAVVTAFVIDSYKGLQADPNDKIVDLLSRIATRLENPLNTTATPPPIEIPFSPPSPAIRLNIFWFLSLVLSLSTVLLGIISLQWLREHQRYDGITPKQSYAIFHLRAEALQKWYVPQLFASLPLLLQGALVLFFVGIIEFLLSLGHKVAIPIIVLITITLLFLIGTTLLPTIQAFPLYIPYLKLHKTGAPAQCPYKSPQSQAFRAMSSVVLWLWSKIVITILYYPIIWIRNIVMRFSNSDQHDDEKRKWLLSFDDILIVWNKKTWIEFDLAWLDVRDNYLTTGQGIHAAMTFPLHVPLYDLVQGLGTAIKEHGVEDSVTFVAAVYHCFQEIAQNTHDIHHWQYPYQRHLQALIKRFLKRGMFGYISDVVDGENVDLLYDENNLAFLTVMVHNRNLEEIVPKTTHFHELQLRVLGFFSVFPSKLKEEPSGQNFPFVIKFDHPGMDTDWDKPVLKDFAHQWATTFYAFFKAFTNDLLPEKILVQSFHAHKISKDFIWGGIVRLKHVHEAKIDSTLVADCLVATIQVCTTTMNKYMADQTSTRRPDLLFSAASSLASYMQSQSWIPDTVYAALSELGPVIVRYGQFTDDLEKNHGQSKMKYVSPQDYHDSDAGTTPDSEGTDSVDTHSEHGPNSDLGTNSEF